MDKTVILKPRLSEKTYALSESRVYVVDIDKNLNRHSVAKAIEKQFEVSVAKVNIVNVKGKRKRIMSITGKRYQNKKGQRPGYKKAYVTLDEGHSLPFFAAVEEEQEKEAATQAKIDKAIEKKDAKETKKATKKRGLARLRGSKKDEE
ncbi:MAG TPA: 50S ribosomal protein L23 [Candidatus Sulfotelmatobacter sp.]|nr:50S ribosomal protein L23 [Candidatus Sulfotelmatobacter sp.]